MRTKLLRLGIPLLIAATGLVGTPASAAGPNVGLSHGHQLYQGEAWTPYYPCEDQGPECHSYFAGFNISSTAGGEAPDGTPWYVETATTCYPPTSPNSPGTPLCGGTIASNGPYTELAETCPAEGTASGTSVEAAESDPSIFGSIGIDPQTGWDFSSVSNNPFTPPAPIYADTLAPVAKIVGKYGNLPIVAETVYGTYNWTRVGVTAVLLTTGTVTVYTYDATTGLYAAHVPVNNGTGVGVAGFASWYPVSNVTSAPSNCNNPVEKFTSLWGAQDF
jgi:hypothetical protein